MARRKAIKDKHFVVKGSKALRPSEEKSLLKKVPKLRKIKPGCGRRS